MRTGQSWCAPERLRVRSYPVSVEEGSAPADPDAPRAGMVKGPYTVETYPVSLDGCSPVVYLVVDV